MFINDQKHKREWDPERVQNDVHFNLLMVTRNKGKNFRVLFIPSFAGFTSPFS